MEENNHISYVNGEPYFRIGPVTSLSAYWIELGVDGNKAGSAGCYSPLREGNFLLTCYNRTTIFFSKMPALFSTPMPDDAILPISQ